MKPMPDPTIQTAPVRLSAARGVLGLVETEDSVMTTSTFTRDEIDTIDRLWRAVAEDHVWTGWAAAEDAPEEVLIYRTKAHWRRFPLRKTDDGYALFIETGRKVAEADTLEALLEKVEAIPGLRLVGDAP